MPNSYMPADGPQVRNRGVLVFGDAMNMRHPLTGGGMTVALRDVELMADLLHPARVPRLQDRDAVQEAAIQQWRRRRQGAAIINVLAQALYSLFAAEGPELRALQKGCFAYFRAGNTDEPLGMMGGLIHSPWTLARHFFTVAFVAIWYDAVGICRGGNPLLQPWWWPLILVEAVCILWKACVAFLPTVYSELG